MSQGWSQWDLAFMEAAAEVGVGVTESNTGDIS